VNAIDYVRDYHNRGWTVVAAPTQQKKPSGAWKQYQTERPTLDLLESWFRRPANVFLLTGAASGGLIVLDCDNEEAVDFWREKIGDALEETASVLTGKGCHYYFQLPEGAVVRNRSNSEGEPPWDIRGEGGGVIAPPSVHETGRVYEWERPPDSIVTAPAELVEYATSGSTADSSNVRSFLNELLQNPPSEGNRNNWLARVAGHYAKYIPHADAYETLVRLANERLDPPLPDEEVEKTIESIWGAQQAKSGNSVPDLDDEGGDRWRMNLRQPLEENGFLVSGGVRILTQARYKSGDEVKYTLEPWLNCDIRVLGIIDTDDERQFSVRLMFPDGRVVEDYVSSKTVSKQEALDAWLAKHGASIGAPDTIFPARLRSTTRLQRYLEGQDAQPMEGAEALGWHEGIGGFITHEGVIRKAGSAPFEHVRPEPNLKKWAPYNYGFGGKDAARRILAEVMTFHDETVTAVFGAWWASVFLKPQIHARSSQFPFMAIEAPSESGKTKGFFPLMMQLAGNSAGHLQPTRASLRDYLSAHHNGIVWMDDLDSLEAYGEILRNVTVRGSMAKKGQDNTSQVVATMRSALVVTGEALGLRDQKALVDRAVALDVSTPMGRRSLRDPSRPQWDDIVDLTTTYPDLSVFAGSIVELALEQADLISSFKSLRVGDGRHADAMAVLRLGARMLRGMLGDLVPGVVERVDEWVRGSIEKYTGKENALTLKLIPTALSSTGWKLRPEPPDETRRMVATPVFVDEQGIVWFSPKLLAEWWLREPKAGRKVSERTESESALMDQARELGLGGKSGVDRKRQKLKGTQEKFMYWRCGDELSATLMKRSKGQEDGDHEYTDDDQGILQ
jgi:hypothetical protein